MWTYSTLFISKEDYYKASKPKKILFSVFSLWTVGCLGIWAIKQQNPEKYYKNVLLSPIIVPVMALTPVIAIYVYSTK